MAQPLKHRPPVRLCPTMPCYVVYCSANAAYSNCCYCNRPTYWKIFFQLLYMSHICNTFCLSIACDSAIRFGPHFLGTYSVWIDCHAIANFCHDVLTPRGAGVPPFSFWLLSKHFELIVFLRLVRDEMNFSIFFHTLTLYICTEQ